MIGYVAGMAVAVVVNDLLETLLIFTTDCSFCHGVVVAVAVIVVVCHGSLWLNVSFPFVSSLVNEEVKERVNERVNVV